MPVHVYTPSGEAKFWLTPNVELAINAGLSAAELRTVRTQILSHEDEIKTGWEKHFG